jgi:PilZ domain-containing protein
MEAISSIRHKRRVALDRAKITLNRNNVLRQSGTGRLLLVLERCVAFVNEPEKMTSRRMSILKNELSYACELADEAGVQNGWINDAPDTFALVFVLSSGDLVFPGLNGSLGAEPFPREPLLSDNGFVVARAVAEILSQAKNSDLRRSTRIPTDANVLVEMPGEEGAYAGETITVNLHGALVRIAAPLKRGDRVTIHVHRTGKSVPASIVFADCGRSQFGIELEHPENVWGVATPPPDWKFASN